MSPLTLEQLASSESAAYASLGVAAQAQLSQANVDLATALGDQQWAATKAAALAGAEAGLRRDMAAATLPSDAAAIAALLEDNLVDQHRTAHAALDAAARAAAAQASAGSAESLLTWALARKAGADADDVTALAREARLTAEQATLATAPYTGLAAAATAALGSADATAATNRVQADLPSVKLRNQRAARTKAARDATTTATTDSHSAEDQLAAGDKKASGDLGALVGLRMAYERADAGYASALGAPGQLAQYISLLKSIPQAAALTAAEIARIADLQTDAENAVTAEQNRDKDVDDRAAKRTKWEDARIASLIAKPDLDPDTVAAVQAALADIPPDTEGPVIEARIALDVAQASGNAGAITAAQTVLDNAIAATKLDAAGRDALARFEAAVPDTTWRIVDDLETASDGLTALTSFDGAALLATLRGAESAYATELQDQGQRDRSNRQIQTYVERRNAGASASAATEGSRAFSAARGDG